MVNINQQSGIHERYMEARNEGLTFAEIGKKFGVSRQAVQMSVKKHYNYTSPVVEKVEVTCSHCKKVELVIPSRKNKRYCNTECHSNAKRLASANLKEKACTKCKEIRPMDDFEKSKKSLNGKGPRCKTCKSTAVKEWNAKLKKESPDKFKAMNKKRNQRAYKKLKQQKYEKENKTNGVG